MSSVRGRFQKAAPGTGKYMIVYEYPDERDDFPGVTIHYYPDWQTAVDVCNMLNRSLAVRQPVQRGERFGLFYVRSKSSGDWPWIDVGFLNNLDNVHESDSRKPPEARRPVSLVRRGGG